MKRLPKKQRERLWLELLQSHLPSLSTAEVVSRETPDFALSLAGARIGLEVTEFCREDVQRQDSLEARVCEQAEQACRDLPPVWVNVAFDQKHALRKGQVPQLSAQLAELVTALVPDECPGQAELRRSWRTLDTIPEWLVHVWIDRLPQLTRSYWQPIRGTFVPTLDTSAVASMVRPKSAQAALYRGEFDEVWLLVVVDGFMVARTASLSDEAQQATYPCAFDRLFVLWDRSNLSELETVGEHA